MKLEKFKEKNKKKIGIILFTVLCIFLVAGVILYRTFAVFETNDKFNVINGSIEDVGDIYFAFYKDGVIQKEMPINEEGYVLDEKQSYCGVLGKKEESIKVSLTEDWKIVIEGVTTSRTKCNLYFVKGVYILGKGVPLVTEGNGLYEVPHEDTTLEGNWKNTEYRYAGVDPDNYVEFNGELWRIVGLVNVKTSGGEIEQRVKIVRKDLLDNLMAWDSNNVNDWTKSSLMKYLNSEYYNSSKNKEMIDENIVWNIGANSDKENKNDLTPAWYQKERGTKGSKGAPEIYEWSLEKTSDSIFHSIGLLYPSDYGYATIGELNRSRCLDLALSEWQDKESCYKNDWLYMKSVYWLITSFSDLDRAFIVSPQGWVNFVDGINDEYQRGVRPTLYLKPTVKIISGNGTIDNSYQLVQIVN